MLSTQLSIVFASIFTLKIVYHTMPLIFKTLYLMISDYLII